MRRVYSNINPEIDSRLRSIIAIDILALFQHRNAFDGKRDLATETNMMLPNSLTVVEISLQQWTRFLRRPALESFRP